MLACFAGCALPMPPDPVASARRSLASLPVASDGTFALSVESSAIVVGTDPWVVTVTAATFALGPGGREASGPARFE